MDKKYGVPEKEVRCPRCGLRYGHHNTKVCNNCQECSKCCPCEKSDLMTADDFIQNSIGYKSIPWSS